MTQTADPWAAASTTQAPAGEKRITPNGETVYVQHSPEKNLATITDPFGTASQVVTTSGATWDPRVPFDEIAGSTVVLVPRSFREDAPDPFNAGKVREEYRADLVVLDGTPFSFTYKSRDSKDAEPTEKTFEVASLPATFRSQSIAQGQLIKLLKGIDKAPDKLFAVGVLLRVPQQRDLSAGFTIDSIEKSRTDYIEMVKRTGKTEPDTRQRSTWGLVDAPQYMTAERWDRARAWWETVKGTWPEITTGK